MEAKKKYEDEILRRVQALPQEQLAKVILPLDSLDGEATPKAGYSESIKKVLGAVTDEHSSSVGFAKRKQEEKSLER